MGKEQSTLRKNGYVITEETENFIVARKEEDSFVIKTIHLSQVREEFSFIINI